VTEEPTNPNQPPNTYEDLRDSARGEAASLWKTADREEASLSKFYEELQDDPRYTSEHKSELAWARYNRAREKIVEGRTKAGEQLANDAAVYRRQALPFPGSEGPITQDSQKIIITQNETARISRKLARMQDSATGPFRPDLKSTPREE
jgi:DNA replication initiation complex subunit (GINS family)